MFRNFTKQQRTAALVLFLIVFAVQLFLFFAAQNDFLSYKPDKTTSDLLEKEFAKLHQNSIDESVPKLYPFNPNFISAYKGYTLGMSEIEIERLKQLRSKDRWVNSAKEFQKVTGIYDSLFEVISPYFKFPKWVTQGQQKSKSSTQKKPKMDLNSASAQQLQSVYGIGSTLSKRIVEFRQKFDGGFAAMVELKAVYGLTDEVIENIKQTFVIHHPRSIVKINLNEAHQEDLVRIPYIDYELAYTIEEMRVLKEGFKSVDELTKLKDFPTEKLDIIKLYLYVN